ncbi:MAG: hypothetical protein HY644_14945 [Acidobacteria bacterium]|nr:hypothetical protein [Acidobacteriota bacterium]
MANNVFVLGAGASAGESLPIAPPMMQQFFDKEVLDKIYASAEAGGLRLPALENAFGDLIDWIRLRWGLLDPFGTAKWRSLNLEDVFTSLAIEQEFFGERSDQGSKAQLRLSELKNYISQVLALTTRGSGKFANYLVRNIDKDDSILNFNYDLLVDREFLPGPQNHYANFHWKILGTAFSALHEGNFSESGIYLKLHGSLNWHTCSSTKCPGAATVHVVGTNPHGKLDLEAFNDCLSATGPVWKQCKTCRSAITCFMIPPLVNKPVLENWVARSIWGHAFDTLVRAKNVVIIGFSFQPTDFYAQWLFRSALQANLQANVWIVNPLNDPNKSGHTDFESRMTQIFGQRCRFDFLRFEEIAKII